MDLSTAPTLSRSRGPLWRRPEFASAAWRAAATVVSVSWFGLSPAAVIVLFCFEAWIYITLRIAVGLAVEEAIRNPDQRRKLLRVLPAKLAPAGLIFGLMIGIGCLAITGTIYKARSFTEISTQLLAEPGFTSSIGVLLLIDSIAAARYAAVLRTGVDPLKESYMLTLYRVWILMVPAALLAKLNVTVEFAGWSMLIAMVLSILFFEGLPTLAKRAMTMRPPGKT